MRRRCVPAQTCTGSATRPAKVVTSDPATARAILHVVAGRERRQLVSGVIDHMAFSASGLVQAVARLKARGIAYELRRPPGGFNIWQLFFRDPNGARVELDFDGDEAGPEA